MAFAVQRFDRVRVVSVGVQIRLGLLEPVRIFVADAVEPLQRSFGVVDRFAFTIVDVLLKPVMSSSSSQMSSSSSVWARRFLS
ncbi:hypothetical protein [Mycobacterium sp.]|uniref:hypothetical protein n=1 Tax=Mycobacterium sp. TaxID=1785 RepID=UPI003CC58B21